MKKHERSSQTRVNNFDLKTSNNPDIYHRKYHHQYQSGSKTARESAEKNKDGYISSPVGQSSSDGLLLSNNYQSTNISSNSRVKHKNTRTKHKEPIKTITVNHLQGSHEENQATAKIIFRKNSDEGRKSSHKYSTKLSYSSNDKIVYKTQSSSNSNSPKKHSSDSYSSSSERKKQKDYNEHYYKNVNPYLDQEASYSSAPIIKYVYKTESGNSPNNSPNISRNSRAEQEEKLSQPQIVNIISSSGSSSSGSKKNKDSKNLGSLSSNSNHKKTIIVTQLPDPLVDPDESTPLSDSKSSTNYYLKNPLNNASFPSVVRSKSIRLKKKTSKDKEESSSLENKSLNNREDNLKNNTTKNHIVKNEKGDSDLEGSFFESEGETFGGNFFQGNDEFFTNGLTNCIPQALGHCQTVVSGVTIDPNIQQSPESPIGDF